MMAKKDTVVSDTIKGVDYLMEKNKIERFLGSGSVKSKGIIIVRDDAKQTKELKTKNIVIDEEINGTKIRFQKVTCKST